MNCDSQRLLSVVVIGLNEEDRLKSSLDAIFANRPQGYDLEVLYVDSGSTDRSVKIASGVPGVEVFRLDSSKPSAARARNAGLRRTRGQFVQLVDGDSVIQPGWLDRAVAILEQNVDISCVFGHCIEMHPDQSIYMKVCGLDWHIPPGEHRFCGGNSMWRSSVISENGFFDETILAGEEPELCYRVRQKGGRILCVDAPMVTHDLGMRRFSQYWNRAVNAGRAHILVAIRFWRNPEKLWFREVLVNFAEPAIWMAIFVAGWHFYGWAGATGFALVWWMIRTLQIAYTVRERELGFGNSLLYGLHCQFVRLPVAIGQLKTLFGSR